MWYGPGTKAFLYQKNRDRGTLRASGCVARLAKIAEKVFTSCIILFNFVPMVAVAD